MKTIIKLKCEDQKLIAVDKPFIASGGINEDIVNFTLSKEWEEMTKTAIFYRESDAIYKVKLDEENNAVVPYQTLIDSGKLYIALYGKHGEQTRTSSIVYIDVKQGAIIDAPQPEDWEQFKKDVVKAINEAFEKDYPEDIPNDELIADIYALDMGADFKNWLIDIVNDNFGEDIPYDISSEDLVRRIGNIESATRVRADIVNTINVQFGTSIPERSSTEEIREAIRHIHTYDDFIKNYQKWIENSTNDDSFPNLWKVSGNYDIKIPYMPTKNWTFRTNSFTYMVGSGVAECGFDISKFNVEYIELFGVASNMKRVFLTGADAIAKNCTSRPYNRMFKGKTKLEELYFDKLSTLIGFGSSRPYFFEMFSGCSNLYKIGGCYWDSDRMELVIDDNKGFIDFTGVTGAGTANMFYNCSSLEDVKFVPNTLKIDLSLSSSGLLTKESVLSLINALDETAINQRISLHSNVRALMLNWYAVFNGELWVECDSSTSGAEKFEDIVIIKNWDVN